jgi:hypothetical protein
MSRTPYESGKAHALFIKFGDLLLVPTYGQHSVSGKAHRGFESVTWALPGGAVATTAQLRERARQRNLVFELITIGKPVHTG